MLQRRLRESLLNVILSLGFPFKCLLSSVALQTEPTQPCLCGPSNGSALWASNESVAWQLYHVMLRISPEVPGLLPHQDEPEHPSPGASPTHSLIKAKGRMQEERNEWSQRLEIQGRELLSQTDPHCRLLTRQSLYLFEPCFPHL